MEFGWFVGWVGSWVQNFHFAMGWVEEIGATDNSERYTHHCDKFKVSWTDHKANAGRKETDLKLTYSSSNMDRVSERMKLHRF